MKSIFSLIILLTFSISGFAQINAVTEKGSEVILYEDGTWKYAENETEVATEIVENQKLFEKDKLASFLVRSQKVNIGVWINPKKWGFKKVQDENQHEYEFNHKTLDLYAMLITEKAQVPLEHMKELALKNGKEVSADLRVVKEEYRTVNDIKVLMLKMAGTIKGIKITYFGYYYSSEKGTVQFLTYTTSNLFDEYKIEMEKMLNGFVEL